MSSTSTKHPKKKLRTGDFQEDNYSRPGPSHEVMPLVAPQLVKKSSKDSNRGMYPSPKVKNKRTYHRHSSSPQFIKASELYKKAPQKEEKVISADSASHSKDSNESLKEQIPSNVNLSTKPKSSFESKRFENKVYLQKQSIRKKYSHNDSSCKVTKNVKASSFPKKQNHQTLKKTRTVIKSEPVITIKSEPVVFESLPGPSGWKKNEKVLGSINEHFFKRYHHSYGLIENKSVTDENDYFEILPTHIMETIFCQMPVVHLMTCRLVCRRWNRIIDNDKFMKWKKVYHKYKRECADPVSNVKAQLNDLMIKHGHSSVENCIETLLKYMANGYNHMPSSEMYDLLVQNSVGELADGVLSERFSEFSGKESRVWCQFALAIILCETVWDIFNLYSSLFKINLACSKPDVIDAMYCVATFLLYFLSCHGINYGLHYRLYYVLYLIENRISKTLRRKLKSVPGQHSIYSYSKTDPTYLTYEQIRILNHHFDSNQIIRIEAFAGAGKTTTLVHLARLYPHIRFLNVVFNKTVCDEAKKKFPLNVTCKTAHSLAYSAVGKYLRHKLVPTIRPFDLIGHLKHNEEHIQIYNYANLVLTTINNFTVSKTNVMCMTHVPIEDFNRKLISNANRDRILMDAFKIWQRMTNEKDSFRITHDGYLKLYHLQQPKLDRYHCIIVDEAQDCNPVILDVLLKQSIPIIFIGDPYQQIYAFRGAENALQNITATHSYNLTKSFRFGPKIAYIASCVLEVMMSSRESNIIGNAKDSFINGNVGGQYAVISRTNMMLFNEALRMIVFKRTKSFEPTNINAAFVGGLHSYGFDQLSDIYKLKASCRDERQLTDRFISRFKSYADLLNYAKHTHDGDLLAKIDVVDQHNSNICKFISILKEKCNYPMEFANVVFSTVHKAKGLEFDSVSLTDDYPVAAVPNYMDNNSFLYSTVQEEANILYVALTRAKSFLLLPEKIKKVLSRVHEYFEYPVSTKSVLCNNQSVKCVQCSAIFTPHTVLLMLRRKIVMASDRKIAEGPLCVKCSSDPCIRPDIHLNGIIMYLDATNDNSHRFMSRITGPLPGDPPIVHDRFSEFQNADRVFVINLNML